MKNIALGKNCGIITYETLSCILLSKLDDMDIANQEQFHDRKS